MEGEFRRKEQNMKVQKPPICNLCNARFLFFQGPVQHVKDSRHGGICEDCVTVFLTEHEHQMHIKIHDVTQKHKKKKKKSKKSSEKND